MFRVNKTEWINPKVADIISIGIDKVNNCGDEAYSVRLETENADYDSDAFSTFEEAEAFVQKLCNAMEWF